jgi:carboxypeptidase PM20D1
MKLLKWGAMALALLVLVLIINTLNFTQQKVQLSPLLDDSALNKQAIAQRLGQAISHQTVSYLPSGPSEQSKQRNPEAFHQFHDFLQASFPKLHQQLQREKVNELSLLYFWQGSDAALKPMLLMSHQDVVPVDNETLSQWTHPPFAGVVRDDIIWGRGAVDIKSGVMGIMEAVEDLLGKGFTPKRSIYLAFGHDEEIGGQQGAKQIAQLLAKRQVSLEFVLDEGGSIVSDGIIPGVKVNVALIGIAEKGYISVKLTANSVGGHSSMPPKHTALGHIAQALVDLENNPFPANLQYSKQLFKNIGPAMELSKKAVFANMWLTQPLIEKILSASKTTNATIRTTTAVTMAQGSSKDNVLPSEASAVVNFRIMPGETVQTVMAYVTKIIANDQIKVQILNGLANEASTISVTNNRNFALLKNSIYRVTQDPTMIVTPYLVTGGTDAKHFSALSDSIYRFAFNRLTPDTLDRMHGINEQIKVDDYIDTVTFFRELMLATNQ